MNMEVLLQLKVQPLFYLLEIQFQLKSKPLFVSFTDRFRDFQVLATYFGELM
jgi:hypothetical protein